MHNYKSFIALLVVAFFVSACTERKQAELTPWGTALYGDTAKEESAFTISDIQSAGEMIMLTMNGPDTYFEYHGRGMGTQFLLCEKFAQQLGVSLRVEVCKDTAEMLTKLENGDADIIAVQLPVKNVKGVEYCAESAGQPKTAWAVSGGNKELADSINRWYRPELLAAVKKEEHYLFSAQSIHRHTYAPMLHADRGVISNYDHLFMRYAPLARWDWRLMAAQCYQESTFDPRAYSWAGAKGLMQIMPSTAAQLGLAQGDIYDPEQNIYAAARYLSKLNGLFRDIRNPQDRQRFVLASYNGGHFHVRDAMALAKKYGRNPQNWNDVAEFVLKLEQAQYYKDPVVKYGYMRGSETVNYVARIIDRWMTYRGAAHGAAKSLGNVGGSIYMPQKARRKSRFHL